MNEEDRPIVKAVRAVMLHTQIFGCTILFGTLGDVHKGFTSSWTCPAHGFLASVEQKWGMDDIETTARIGA